MGEQFLLALRAAQQGNEESLAMLWRAHQPSVLNYLRYVAAGYAEDVASEAWMDVARNLRRFEGDERAFKSWLFKIVRRRVVDHRRKQTRRVDETPLEHNGEMWDQAIGDESVALKLDQHRLTRLIRTVLAPDQADAVILRTLVGLDTAEVARILGKRDGAVRILLHRGLKRLSHEIFEEGV